ncbi:MAG TPA: ATP-dependent DNA helicase RecG, partial [Acetobacteraceae bacterium]|nr:ATP-dependent DNA helicase RecG [Acetobacteraceae bacterium]
VLVSDGTARAELVYFRAFPGQVERLFPVGASRRVSGRLVAHGGRLSMPHPDYVEPPDRIPPIEPLWPLTQGLTRRTLAKVIRAALDRLPDLPEWQDPALLRREGWPAFAAALRALHEPDPDAPDPAALLPPARQRLAFDELLAGQIALGLVRRRVRERPGRLLAGDGALRAKALAAFGHAPTPSQARAMEEIAADLAAPRRMLRLLQGDVGAGKTLVAVMAMLQAVEAGAQAVLMAPTELLARQHLRTFERLCTPAGVRVALLSGSLKSRARREVLEGLASGDIHIAVGTHALFQEGVEFRDLALAVVDEQHRFGVAQRLALAGKGAGVDVLAMTATPIPRTLLLTRWGEMAVSRLEGKPAGRQPIRTSIVGQDRLPEVVTRLHAAFARGERAYWVVRAVTGGEKDDSVAAEDRFVELGAHFPGRVGLAHGQMDVTLREKALADFAEGTTQLLVATTVVEVGVDVPDATIMIIEQAERFGLAALHQLRGRVGRGTKPSSCLLIHSEGAMPGEVKRLLVLRDTEDGFLIAEEDFAHRGAGDALGARQAGQQGARLSDPKADPEGHGRLVQVAHRDAQLLLDRDPDLRSPRGRAAAGLLLPIFGHDPEMGPLEAG